MLFKNTLPINQRHKSGNQSSLIDRIWIEQKYLPKLEGSVLYVGVSYYTDFYHELVKNPEKFVTIDLNKDVAKFGSPFEHHIDSIQNFLEKSNRKFNHISLFGLFGQKHSVINDIGIIINIINKSCDHINELGTINFGFNNETIDFSEKNNIINASKLSKFEIIDDFICKPSPVHTETYIFWGKNVRIT